MSGTERVLGGRWRLVEHLADGGMGAVWRGDDVSSGRPVAVKLMRVDGTVRADLRARFEQEARAVALLKNPHVVEVIDHGTDDGTPYIVMELLDGVDLLALRENAGAWPLSEVAELVIQLARGLGAAHRAGLIHRDVKPANIVLARTSRDDEVVAKVIDFGIAKWTENTEIRTAANVALGSPSYMSPEQIRGQPLDARADVWALAVVAYTLVTGELPFVGRNGPDIARQVVLGHRKAISPPIPQAARLERFFARAFDRDPAARFRSVEELAGALVVAADAPTPLKTAARAVASMRRGVVFVDDPTFVDEASTGRLTKPLPRPDVASSEHLVDDPTYVEDLERTETDGPNDVDPLNASAGAAGRARRSG